jgi:hypothetical protein
VYENKIMLSQAHDSKNNMPTQNWKVVLYVELKDSLQGSEQCHLQVVLYVFGTFMWFWVYRFISSFQPIEYIVLWAIILQSKPTLPQPPPPSRCPLRVQLKDRAEKCNMWLSEVELLSVLVRYVKWNAREVGISGIYTVTTQYVFL